MTKAEYFIDEMHKILDIIETAEMSSEDKFSTVALRLFKSEFVPQLNSAILTQICLMYDISLDKSARLMGEAGEKYLKDSIESLTESVKKGVKNDN